MTDARLWYTLCKCHRPPPFRSETQRVRLCLVSKHANTRKMRGHRMPDAATSCWGSSQVKTSCHWCNPLYCMHQIQQKDRLTETQRVMTDQWLPWTQGFASTMQRPEYEDACIHANAPCNHHTVCPWAPNVSETSRNDTAMPCVVWGVWCIIPLLACRVRQRK